MYTLTHLSMARKILESVEMNVPVRLDAHGFLTGSIKPDMPFYMPGIPHYKEEAMGFIQSEIKELTSLKLQKNGRVGQVFFILLLAPHSAPCRLTYFKP